MQVITPHPSDLGDGFLVHRALPSAARRAVGPFVFLDQFGPVQLSPGKGLDVRPHPHIGLATVSYLFEGTILHRDSLGSVVPIRPGEVNWMTAGRGIVHSERSPDELRAGGPRLWGLQFWVALPRELEQCAPAFAHHGADEIPRVTREGEVRANDADAATAKEHLVVFDAGETARLTAGAEPAHVVFLGGPPLDAPRFLWWNFVSSDRDLILEAQAAWTEQRFPKVPGETEFIPLPSRPLPPGSAL